MTRTRQRVPKRCSAAAWQSNKEEIAMAPRTGRSGGRGREEGGASRRVGAREMMREGWRGDEKEVKVRKSAHSTTDAHAPVRDLCGLLLAARGIRTFAQLRRRVEVCVVS